MKRILFIFLSLVFFFTPSIAHADDSWVIENFNSNIAIQQSGVVRVVETIAVDFKDTPKHGIYRDIPYLYESGGKQTYTQIAITDVLQNKSHAHYETSETNGYEEIKIGDPDRTITGRNEYTIMYTVTGVLRGFSDHDELYWNVTGNDWQVTIQKAQATVTLPASGITKITCFEGFSDSQTPCQSNSVSPQVATFTTTNSLAESEGLTVVVGYNKGLVPLLTAKPPQSYWEKLVALPSVLTTVATLLAGVLLIGYRWFRYGRDYWFAGNLFGTKEQTGTMKPIGAHETISVEFTPPENLRPAEIGVLMDERADTLDVTATIIDLAARGYLTITEVPKKWLFGKVDYTLTQTTPTKKLRQIPLAAYEQLLLDKLFENGNQVTLSSLKTTFYDDLAEVKQSLYSDVVAKELFPFDPEETRNKYRVVAIFCMASGVALLFAGYKLPVFLFGSIGIGLVASGLLLLLVLRFMPRKTAYGRELYRRAKGYYLFIDKAEKYRQQYFEKENMFNEVLPYAIVFGLTKKFAKQMDKMGIKPTQPDWYYGTHPFTTGVFIGSLNNFSSSFSSAIASTPSKGGGFSGGSSGGGFGGGGGGSW